MSTPMTAREESFLVLEQSLTNRISRQWESDINGTLNEIVRAVNEARWQDAERLCEDLSMQKVAEQNKRYMEFIGMQAVLFGASRLTRGRVDSTMFTGPDAELPPEVERSSQALSEGLSTEGSEDVCRHAQRLIAQERAAQEDAAYATEEPSTGDVDTIEDTRTLSERRKDATDTFIRRFRSSVKGNGEAYINITGSLHTSRLGGWGFLQEAKFRGITKYQVSEQLDSRTCKVCQTMNGRYFDVGPADQKLNNWLSVENLQQFKSIEPFPSQSAASIKSLASMPSSDIANKGWDTPPYHPRCRGILVEIGAIPLKEPVPRQAVPEVPDAVPAPAQPNVLYTDEYAASMHEKYGMKIVDQYDGDFTAGWTSVMGDVTPEDAYKSIFAGMTTRPKKLPKLDDDISFTTVTVRGDSDHVRINIKGDLVDKDNNTIGSMMRVITRDGDEITVKHSLFQLDSAVQGSGLGKRTLRESIDLYEQIGVTKVNVFANIDAGGYAWARYGYKPIARDWPELQSRARAALANIADDIPDAVRAQINTILSDPDPAAIWRLADIRTPVTIRLSQPPIPLGRALLQGSDWNGVLDLTDPEAMKRFRNYVGP
jgi:hypothetical protein